MPYSHLPRDKAEALDALERLVLRHKLVGEDEGRRIARVITDDPSFQFPPPRAEPAAPAGPAAPAEPAAKESADAEAPAEGAAAPSGPSGRDDEREDEGRAPSAP